MIRFKISAGAAAFAVTLASLFAAVDAPVARAEQNDGAAPAAQHTQQPAEEIVPLFVAKPVVQPLPEPAATPTETASASSLRELVAEMPGDAPMDEEMRCLAGAVYFEARGEPLSGQLAVAQVVVNRAASGKFPASYCGVVHQPSQFSFVKRGRMPSINTGSISWQRAKAIARIAHKGLWESEADDSLYFHARSVSPGWSSRRQASARISNHVFYR